MLEELRIQSLGVIAEATLEFASGLTVVTGETGAGKTMVVAGLDLLFGGRADAGRVRAGAGRAVVEGRLQPPPDSAALARAADAGAEADEDGSLVATRSVTAEGRSRGYLGGRSVPVSVLAELGEDLLAVHGQSDHFRLLRPAHQRAVLDRYAGPDLAVLLGRHRELFRRWQEVAADLAERSERARERQQEADLLRYGLAEIAAADPQPGEDTALAAEAERLAHADALRVAAQTAHEALVGDPTGDQPDVAGLLGAARRALAQASVHDGALTGFANRLGEVGYLAADVATELASYAGSLDADPARLAQVQERQATLQALTRKYADTVDGVVTWAERATASLAGLDSSEEALAALRAECDALAGELGALAGQLSAARQAVAAQFGAAVTAELGGLAMPQAVVVAELTQRPAAGGSPAVVVGDRLLAIGPEGVDEVELQFVPHPGVAARPLQKTASGGELSRVMLAVEVVFAGADGVPTMVFDEVDAGVGGRAAVEVGRRLARLARSHQVIVVTHLPQVAAYADRHLVAVKDDDGLVTTSGVRTVERDERVRELARMLAGLDGSEHGLAHAAELLATAQAEKAAPPDG